MVIKVITIIFSSMDQHPMPRQITSFEFKLIGFLTLKQFIYLVIFFPAGFLIFKIIPIPLLNILLAVVVAGAGAAFAFVPVNERPLDVWIKNLFKRLTTATQYTYQKHDQPIYFLKNLLFMSDPHKVMSHVESEEKLASYLATVQKKENETKRKKHILSLFQKSHHELVGVKKNVAPVSAAKEVVVKEPIKTVQTPIEKKPFFVGVVKNHKLIPLPGVLIYVRDENGKILRLLKTNPHGVFATFNPLPVSEYQFEFKDPKGTYFFDTMKLKIEDQNSKSFEIFSKELI